jgi:hypothetical protein
MKRQAAAVLWAMLLLAAACGAPESDGPAPPVPGSPHALALDFIAAVPVEKPKVWMGMLEQPHDAAEYGWQEGIRQGMVVLKDIEFKVIRSTEASDGDPARATVDVQMTLGGPKRRASEGTLHFVRQGSDWRLTVKSMIRFFEEGQAVATGVPRNVHMTWLLVHLLHFKAEAFPLNLGMQGFEKRYPEGWHEIVDSDADYPLSEEGEPLDAWGRPIHYEVKPDGTFDLRSAGEDGILHTLDDVTSKRPEPE